MLKHTVGLAEEVLEAIGDKESSNGAVVGIHAVAKDVADELAYGAIGGFKGGMDVMPLSDKALCQELDLGAFAAAVDAFKGYQEVFLHW